MKDGGKAKRQPKRFKIKDLMIEVMDWKGIRMAGPCACDTYCTECSGRPTCDVCSDCTATCTCSDWRTPDTDPTKAHRSAAEAVSLFTHLEKKLTEVLAEVKKQKKVWTTKNKKSKRR